MNREKMRTASSILTQPFGETPKLHVEMEQNTCMDCNSALTFHSVDIENNFSATESLSLAEEILITLPTEILSRELDSDPTQRTAEPSC